MEVDFSLCVICQEDCTEILRCPIDGNDKQNLRKPYRELLDRAKELIDIGEKNCISEEYLNKLDEEQLITKKAKWHKSCKLNYTASKVEKCRKRAYNSNIGIGAGEGEIKRSRVGRPQINDKDRLQELVNFIKSEHKSGRNTFVLSDLHKRYISNYEGDTINRFRLKEKLLNLLPDLREKVVGRNSILSFDSSDDMTAEENDILVKAAAILRRRILENSGGYKFDGKFSESCQEDSIPSSLLGFIKNVISPDSKNQYCQHCLTLAQLIVYNTKGQRYNKSNMTRHTLRREPPLPIYLGLCIHLQSRNKSLIEKLSALGLSITYTRVSDLEENISNTLCDSFEKEMIVCPSNLRKGIFTIGALDNIDHDPSSNTANDSLHGTGISIVQFPTLLNPGEQRPSIKLSDCTDKKELPSDYTDVEEIAVKRSNVKVPSVPDVIESDDQTVKNEKQFELDWASQAREMLSHDEVGHLKWEAYFSNLEKEQGDKLPCVGSMLPLFHNKAATPEMIKHGFNIVKKATEYLNSGQIPVIALDQPLFTLAKYVQWQYHDVYGEQKFVVLLGGLHLEMVLWTALGDILKGSGWTEALLESGFATPGRVESLLSTSHLKRTRHAHTVTLLSLHCLINSAFEELQHPYDDEEKWISEMEKSCPTFFFWRMIMDYEVLVLMFVRAHRQGNFTLYIAILEKLVHLFFAMDHYNYARWASVHIRDMKSLPDTIMQEFMNGNWVVRRSKNPFSLIPIDQGHEQLNKEVKGPGGIVGLTENPAALRRWLISGPDLSRLLEEFESSSLPTGSFKILRHHETEKSKQEKFKSQVKNLVQTFVTMGNPFSENHPELMVLNSRICIEDDGINTLRSFQNEGQIQYENFKKTVIQGQIPIDTPLKKNTYNIFTTKKARTTSCKKELQSNITLFSQLYIATDTRNGDLDEFFSHETQSYPPALSDLGYLHKCQKSQLLNCLTVTDNSDIETPSTGFDATILDGAAIIHMIQPHPTAKTFDDYFQMSFLPYIKAKLQNSHEVHLAWDMYWDNSLKNETREKRGQGTRRKVLSTSKLPANWNDFLKNATNKAELFSLITEWLTKTKISTELLLYVNAGSEIQMVGTGREMIADCHEEADTMIIRHVIHAVENGAKSVHVKTVDTDVCILLIAHFEKYRSANVWLSLGSGKSMRWIHVNACFEKLGKAKSWSLLLFHAITGSDTTSSFRGKGKLQAWKTWKNMPQLTPVLESINPFRKSTVSSQHFLVLEEFVTRLYGDPFNNSVNKCRRYLFCKRNIKLENLPPTQDALLLHVQRAIYQASIWMLAHLPAYDLPSPAEFGWQEDKTGQWLPVWISQPAVPKACRVLVKCCCKGRCTGRCSCIRAKLPCCELCRCHCLD